MKSLKTLIKLHKRNLDEKRRELVKEEQFRTEVEEILEKQKAETKSEGDFTSGNSEVNFIYANYIDRAIRRKEKILEVLQQQDENIEKIVSEIPELYADMKRYEIINELKEKKERLLAEKKEQDMLDEISLNYFNSQQED